ncbi:MAG TPA: biosynthetic arginine decarboxylase [Gammaproteobacteria bacterium]|nr:biosynthetic arginine decarboxylase [Gammaproteobacteria bacterium]
MNSWDIEKARETYNVGRWGDGYFEVGDDGHALARPAGPDGPAVDLHDLAGELRRQGLTPPVLVRFPDILRHRLDALRDAFGTAMRAHDYRAAYTPVYPIKVNQQHTVVAEILGHGDVGLEAGSKPELLAVLALAASDGGFIVCNGYKDREYIRLALIGRLLGKRVYIVVEKLSELELILEEAQRLDIPPLLGVRVRLASIGKGKWQNTGGEKSKFGFAAAQLLEMVERLRAAGCLDRLQLLHFHLGSQIANIRDIQRGMREAARHYAELHRLGVPIRIVDVGGGLGVDYEGSRSRSFCSMNYTVQEYANNVVHALWEICQQQHLPQPDIVTESGRAMTAHHALLMVNVIDVEHQPAEEGAPAVSADDPQVLRDLSQALRSLDSRSVIETYHDAGHWLALSQEMYTHGVLSLAQRAVAEKLYYAICRRLLPLLQPATRSHREILDELKEKLADKYFCNFSIFQSIPDVWAIDQIFPIMPLHRLEEPPTRRAVITDITCDSDGRIDHYVDREGVESTLPLHAVSSGGDYLLGIFLVGAYQEILGDMHNLFGDTHAVNVVLEPDGGHRLSEPQRGDTVDEVLRYVRYDTEELLERLRHKTRQAGLDEDRSRLCLQALEAGVGGYTYLED